MRRKATLHVSTYAQLMGQVIVSLTQLALSRHLNTWTESEMAGVQMLWMIVS